MPRPPATSQRCARCPATIRWAFTEKGKRISLDYDPDPHGNVFLGPAPYDGTGRVLARVRADLVVIDLATTGGTSVFMPHAATCGKRYDCGHTCCEHPHDRSHDHVLAPDECPACPR